MGIYKHSIDLILENKRRQESGLINCIPSPITSLIEDFPGIQQGTYYLVSATTKGGKTQFTNYMFVYNTLEYALCHPDECRVKILYYALEEAPTTIMLRYMSNLLFTLDKIQISPMNLKSIKKGYSVSNEIVHKLQSDPRYTSRLQFFDDHVQFMQSTNPTGILKEIESYCLEHGTVHKKQVSINDNLIDVFDYYEPKDKEEYVIVIVDHISLISTERFEGEVLDLRKSILRLSQRMTKLRNRFNIIPVIVQQQSTEVSNFDAVQQNKIDPTREGLADCKDTGKDVNVMIGLTSPWVFGMANNHGYDITRLKDNYRYMKIILNREGSAPIGTGLYFNGACNYFHELPSPKDMTRMETWYQNIENLRKK